MEEQIAQAKQELLLECSKETLDRAKIFELLEQLLQAYKVCRNKAYSVGRQGQTQSGKRINAC
jgi:hypothetical protein